MSVSLYGSGNTLVQLVNTQVAGGFTTSSTSFTNITGLAGTITPNSTSNKILITVTLNSQNLAGNFLAIARNGTIIQTCSALYTATNTLVPLTLQFLDSPSTTSATTYQIQGATASGTAAFNGTLGGIDTARYMTLNLMEIAYA